MNSTVTGQILGKSWNEMTPAERDQQSAWLSGERTAAIARKAKAAERKEARKSADRDEDGVVTRKAVDEALNRLRQPQQPTVAENTNVTTTTTAIAQDWQQATAIFNGTYTLVGPRGRRTIEVETIKPGQHGTSPFVAKFLGQRVVKMLVGPDNTSDYRMIGWLKNDQFVATQKNVGTDNEKIGLAFVKIITVGIDGYSFLLASTCRRCGRKLTVPSSIDEGVGPDCAGKGAFSL